MLAVAIAVGAQQKPILVGEYTGQSLDPEQITKEVRLFLKRLESETQTVRGAIALINSFKFAGVCADNHLVEDKNFENAVKASIPKKNRERVTIVSSDQWGLRGEAYFYLFPSGAGLPQIIKREVNPPCCCSEISIVGSSEVVQRRQRVKYKLVLPIQSSRVPPKPMWTISSGKIVGGQGTSTIEADISSSTEERIKVEVSIEDPSPVCGCPTTATFTTWILQR